MGPYESSPWYHYKPETTYYRFESIREDPMVGATYFTANALTVFFIPDDQNDTSTHALYIFLPGQSPRNYPTNQEGVGLVLDLSTSEYPVSFWSVPDTTGGYIRVDQYPPAGLAISGEIWCRLRVLGTDQFYWTLKGTFTVPRRPDNSTDTLFETSVSKAWMQR